MAPVVVASRVFVKRIIRPLCSCERILLHRTLYVHVLIELLFLEMAEVLRIPNIQIHKFFYPWLVHGRHV